MRVNLVFRGRTCTDLNGEDGCIPDQKRFDLEGLAEGSSLVHGTHRCGLICIDVLSQLLSEGKNSNITAAGTERSEKETDLRSWHHSKTQI